MRSRSNRAPLLLGLISPAPVTIGRSKSGMSAILLPFVAAAVVIAGLCSFLFVRSPPGPEVQPPAQVAVLQQPERSTGPPLPPATVYSSWASLRSAPLPPAPKLVPQSAADLPAAAQPPDAPAPQQAGALSDGEVQEVQNRLQGLQLDPGPADGVAGPQTISAIQRYQSGKGQTPTGQLDRQLLESLRRDKSAAR